MRTQIRLEYFLLSLFPTYLLIVLPAPFPSYYNTERWSSRKGSAQRWYILPDRSVPSSPKISQNLYVVFCYTTPTTEVPGKSPPHM